jgi:hypothetical protein
LLGHSGGAVPELNRSSLFAGVSRKEAAGHQRTLITQKVNLAGTGGGVNSTGRWAALSLRCFLLGFVGAIRLAHHL